jgi:hypothetical protein
MVMKISTEIMINSPAEKVWGILTDFEKYPEWNPFIKRISGDLSVGGKLDVYMKPPGGKGMRFLPRVVLLDGKKEFRWLGKLFMHGIFDGEHIFSIEKISDNRVNFIHSENFKGILVPIFVGNLKSRVLDGFREMNQALKDRAESGDL